MGRVNLPKIAKVRRLLMPRFQGNYTFESLMSTFSNWVILCLAVGTIS